MYFISPEMTLFYSLPQVFDMSDIPLLKRVAVVLPEWCESLLLAGSKTAVAAGTLKRGSANLQTVRWWGHAEQT